MYLKNNKITRYLKLLAPAQIKCTVEIFTFTVSEGIVSYARILICYCACTLFIAGNGEVEGAGYREAVIHVVGYTRQTTSHDYTIGYVVYFD